MVLKFKRYPIPTLLKVGVIIPLCVFSYVAGFGYIFGSGHNLLGWIVSWFVIVPLLTLFLSKVISGKKNLPLKALISLLIFYGVMVFMIYKHYQTDFFKVMMASLIFNSFVMLVAISAGWLRQKSTK